ncbi:hypothetical protein KJP29_17560 [Maritimibacter sp. DP1N21-5]|nr:hypothetical protein [Maritimibacter sp. DP1N21-5]
MLSALPLPSRHTALPARGWPLPPAAVPHALLDRPPEKARVVVAGLVLVRQRPGTANGVIFITLEDETGIANVVVWTKVYERFRRAVVAGRALRVTGRIERESGVAHVIADQVEDISWMLDSIALPADALPKPGAHSQPPAHVRGTGARLPSPRTEAWQIGGKCERG